MNVKTKIVCVYALFLATLSPASFSQGVPTVDAAALVNMAQAAARDIAHYKDVLGNMNKQIQTSQSQLQSMTGIRNIANLANDISKISQNSSGLSQVFQAPEKFFQNGIKALSPEEQALMNKYGVNEICAKFPDQSERKNICEANLTAKVATAQQNNILMGQLNQALNQLSDLSVKANNSTDLKMSQDIANQIAILNASIQAIQYSLDAAYRQEQSFDSMVKARQLQDSHSRNRQPFRLEAETGDNSNVQEQW